MLSLSRRQRKLALQGLAAAVILLIIALVGPHALLFAEQDAQVAGVSPLATPTPLSTGYLDYLDNLPICPDDSLTPSVGPTAVPDPLATSSCRISPDRIVATIDIKALYDQGADLAAMGFPGDPDPASALTDADFAMLTPMAQATLAAATPPTPAAPVPQLLPRLYLPFLDAGSGMAAASTEPAAIPVPTSTVIYTENLNHPYIPIDQLPECEDVTVTGPDYSVPNFYAPQCRARIVASVDIKALYDQGVDLEARGLPRDPPPGSAPLILGTPVAQAASFAAPATPAPAESAPQIVPQLYLPFLTAD